MAGQSGHRARPSLAGRRGKLAQGPTQHNGLSHVAGPQAAAKALLGGPAARDPRYVLRPLPCACGLLLTACSNKPHARSHLVGAVTAGAVTAECSGQARSAQSVVLAPAHPVWASAVPVALSVGHGSLAHRRASPALAHQPHPSWWRGCSSGASQSRPLRAAQARWPLASLDSMTPPPPVSLERGGVPLHARRAGPHS